MRGFSTLEDAIAEIPRARRSAPFTMDAQGDASSAAEAPSRDRDLQDVVNHLHAWHVLLLEWLDAVEADRVPAYPAEGRSWAELDLLNRELRDKYRVRRLGPAISRLQTSHVGALARVGALDETMLFDEDRFDWLGGAPLADPVHECLGGHYAWAVAAIGGRW